MKIRGGVKGRLELFRKFIRFGSVTRLSLKVFFTKSNKSFRPINTKQ